MRRRAPVPPPSLLGPPSLRALASSHNMPHAIAAVRRRGRPCSHHAPTPSPPLPPRAGASKAPAVVAAVPASATTAHRRRHRRPRVVAYVAAHTACRRGSRRRWSSCPRRLAPLQPSCRRWSFSSRRRRRAQLPPEPTQPPPTVLLPSSPLCSRRYRLRSSSSCRRPCSQRGHRRAAVASPAICALVKEVVREDKE